MAEEKQAIATDTGEFVKEVKDDFYMACLSREASLLGRKEVLTGKAKFGIFGDGKEVAQLAMAKQFQNGDFRAGYYRDQTLMMAIGQHTIKEAFSALYAHPDIASEPGSGGRQMGGHYASRTLNEDGSWKNAMEEKHSSADVSPTASQMPRLLGLAQASKIYRHNELLHQGYEKFSDKGSEVAFGTIGDSSTSEGLFWETFNAAGVLQVPMVLSVWDDGYGISVPKTYQTTKGDISEALKGFQRSENSEGYELFRVKGWDYPNLVATYEKAVKIAREEHVPVMVHVEEVTQPQGHSTSGSHERYKSKERLQWAKEYDCITQFRSWMLSRELASEEELDEMADNAKKEVRRVQKEAWQEFQNPIKQMRDEAVEKLEKLAAESVNGDAISSISEALNKDAAPIRKTVFAAVRKALRFVRGQSGSARQNLVQWIDEKRKLMDEVYGSHLYSESDQNVLSIEEVPPQYDDDAGEIDGRKVLRDNFEALFDKYPELLTFGEDVGKIGGVNQSMEGMQEKFGELRVSDTGIREATIVGQGIGMAMRGLRPVAEIQYLDYTLYCLQTMSDDLATVQYRTSGGQKAPLIVRTRGHRLEGIWHSGSPMGGLINLLRGVRVCVPRNMTQAAGMYNTLLQSDEPALMVESLNAYRSKEKRPGNLGEFTVPLGKPEVVREGTHLTLVSYGSTFNICQEVAGHLLEVGIDVELIDVRTLLPFDVNHDIARSLKHTNRLLIVDEDVPGGTSAYILDKVINEQKGYYLLDSEPVTLTSHDHRPAYATDGDYFSKPNAEDIFECAYRIMEESDPEKFPKLY